MTCVAGFSLAACTQFPELDGTVPAELAGAPYPTLQPIEPLLAQATPSALDPQTEEASLNARLAGLRARAGAMRGSVLSGADRRRLDEGVEER